ncbi:MAG: type 4a pilus biogenesis protein PilO [Gemmatimonadaceae bacterium]|nr:type 4a pilus biogenesis protein PilO [Gemmatimonadaceae bacterium]
MAGLPTNQRDQLLFFLAFLGVVGAGAYWYFAFAPNQERLTTLAAHVDSLDAGNQRAKAQLARGSVASIRAESQRLRANLELMRTLVPAGNEVPALLEQVSTAARRVGLEIGYIEPEPVIQGEQFDTYRYKLRAIGDYHEIGALLTGIASMTRIVAPLGLQLQISGAAGGAGAKLQNSADRVPLQANFTIQTYAVKTAVSDDAGNGAPPPKPGRKG